MVSKARGFTLVELMVVVAVIGILTAIAVPAYTQYMLRSRLTAGFSALATVELAAEQHWANGRTYVGFSRLPADNTYFTYAASNLGVSTYTVTATGRAAAANFKYTIDHTGTKKTTQVPTSPTGWSTSNTCWVDRKGGLCSE